MSDDYTINIDGPISPDEKTGVMFIDSERIIITDPGRFAYDKNGNVITLRPMKATRGYLAGRQPRAGGEAMKHCLHSSGVGTSTALMGLNSGTQETVCCNCGKRMKIRWHEESLPVMGHGKYYTHIARIYDESDEECPGPSESGTLDTTKPDATMTLLDGTQLMFNNYFLGGDVNPAPEETE